MFKNNPFGLALHPVEAETVRRVQNMGFLSHITVVEEEEVEEESEE